MKCYFDLILRVSFAAVLIFDFNLIDPVVASSKPAKLPDSTKHKDSQELTPEDEISLSRKDILIDRPYELSYSNLQGILVFNVLLSEQSSPVIPDWWSEKQAVDIARIFALALSRYPGVKVLPPETWDERTARAEHSPALLDQKIDPLPAKNETPYNSILHSASLPNNTINTQMNVLDYGFQYMPVKRRGIGLGFIALNTKECSTETYLKTDVLISLPSDISNNQSVGFSRMIKSRTGGASLNLNFLAGGAGGGNFKPPAKPLKRIIYDSAVDAAEAAFCLASNQESCIKYYKFRPNLQPTKLTDKQRRKVESC